MILNYGRYRGRSASARYLLARAGDSPYVLGFSRGRRGEGLSALSSLRVVALFCAAFRRLRDGSLEV